MMQNILVIIIASVSILYVALKIYRFFKSSGESGSCHSGACASCPYGDKGRCEDEERIQKQKK